MIGQEAGGDILAERQRGVAFDGDAIVVVNPNQIIQAEVAGERGRFAGNALHHATIAGNRKNFVIDYVVAGPIEIIREPFFRNGHADAVRHALTERTGGGFHAGRQTIFRMTGAFAMQLAKVHDVVERNVVTRYVQNAV
ncbi:MAG: hypothetical protein ALAOOOJD_03376 [bacterium]|nr:hypothetical protein [bacterium]